MDFDAERFSVYFSHLLIPAKEGGGAGEALEGGGVLGRYRLNAAQVYLTKAVSEGLQSGVHIYWVLKAAQAGCTTWALALLSYWSQVHAGMIFGHIAEDTDHKEVNRALLAGMLGGLPPEWTYRAPKNNRVYLEFGNGSRIVWLNANAKSGKKSGLAQGIGMLGVHGTELGSWEDEVGVKLMLSRLAESNPARLYIFEGTAKGSGLFKDYWSAAAAEGATGKNGARALFLGWWLNDFYRFDLKRPADSALHERYWDGRLSRWEESRASLVRERYGYELAPQQISWMRWKGATAYRGSTELLLQEYPWIAEDAWAYGARGYVEPLALARARKALVGAQSQREKNRFIYHLGCDFHVSSFEQVGPHSHDFDLEIFESPSSAGPRSNERIVISLDPANGANPKSDLAVIEVWRAHTDRLVQLAEYTRSGAPAHHLAWVILELAALYDAPTKVIYELQGGGYAVHDHLKMLREQLRTGYSPSLIKYFRSLDFYRYSRPDARRRVSASEGWITSGRNRTYILDNLRSQFELGNITVRSLALLDEMKYTTREADGYIKAPHDDNRLFAAAFGVEGWHQLIIEDIRDLEMFSFAAWTRNQKSLLPTSGEPEVASRSLLLERVSSWKDDLARQISKESRSLELARISGYDPEEDFYAQTPEELDQEELEDFE